MIVLDTNVVSMLMESTSHPAATSWLDRQVAASIYITAITRAEVRYGIARLPPGRRRTAYEHAADRFFATQSDRTLDFDAVAADAYGVLVAERERLGRPIGVADAQIAAIALARGAAVATRDVGGFDRTGVKVIDPFA